MSNGLDAILARYGSGWRRPSIGEAVLRGRASMGARGQGEIAPRLGRVASRAISTDLGFRLRWDRLVGSRRANCGSARSSSRCSGSGCRATKRDLLGGTPLEDLDEIRPDQIARLRSRRIETLDALAGLEPPQARAILGFEGERLVGQVRGGGPGLDPETGPRPEALALLARRLSGRLDRGRFLARGLELALDYADGVRRERHSYLPRPTSSADDLAEAAFRLFRRLPEIRRSPWRTLAHGDRSPLPRSSSTSSARPGLEKCGLRWDAPVMMPTIPWCIDSARRESVCSAQQSGGDGP